ncbi:hypothetical protein BDV95DRAFT_458192, partial [Massariosphaeria phaeospora]
LAPRCVHLRIQPRPANLSESREVFRLLQRFGEVSTCKYLRYEYHNPADNIALAIYRDSGSAQKALDASPIRFSLERLASSEPAAEYETYESPTSQLERLASNEPSTPSKNGIDDLLRPSQLINRSPPDTPQHANNPSATAPPPPPPMPFAEPSPAKPTKTKWFQVTVDRSRVVHADFVERQPYYKQFTPMKSMAQEDLAKVVPHIGLSDVSKRPPNQHRTPNRVLKTMAYTLENRMPSLRDMYEE